MKWYNYVIALLMSIITGTSAVMTLTTFATFGLLGGKLTPQIIFPTIYLFKVAEWPLIDWPFTFARMARAIASTKRIQAFMNCAEVEEVERCARRPGAPAIMYVCVVNLVISSIQSNSGKVSTTAPFGGHLQREKRSAVSIFVRRLES